MMPRGVGMDGSFVQDGWDPSSGGWDPIQKPVTVKLLTLSGGAPWE